MKKTLLPYVGKNVYKATAAEYHKINKYPWKNNVPLPELSIKLKSRDLITPSWITSI